MKTEQEYAELAQWAENVDPAAINGGTVRRGTAAAAHARAVLEEAAGGVEQLQKALGGRPSIDPAARPGQRARVRHLRLPAAVSAAVDEIAAVEHRTASEVMRDAVAQYVTAHKTA